MPSTTLRSRAFCLSLGVALAAAAPSTVLAQVERGVIYRDAPAMNAVIETRVGPQMDQLLVRLITEGRDMTLDGVQVFEAKDKFLPGKIAIGLAHAALDAPEGDPRRGCRPVR